MYVLILMTIQRTFKPEYLHSRKAVRDGAKSRNAVSILQEKDRHLSTRTRLEGLGRGRNSCFNFPSASPCIRFGHSGFHRPSAPIHRCQGKKVKPIVLFDLEYFTEIADKETCEKNDVIWCASPQILGFCTSNDII